MPSSRPSTPQVGVGAIVRREDAVLLVCRAKSPFKGEWAVPGGRVRLGESLKEATEREVLEETGVTVAASEPVYTFEYIERDPTGAVIFHYIVVDLRARYLSGTPKAGDDASEARWVRFCEMRGLPINTVTLTALGKLFPDQICGMT